MSDLDRIFLAFTFSALFLVTTGDQDRIVYGRTQLDRSDNDGSDERKFCSRQERDTHIDKDRTLDDHNQDHRKRDRFKYEENDKEYCQDRYRTDHCKVVVGDLDQIFRTRCFTYQHTGRIVLFQDRVDLTQLTVDLIGCYRIFVHDQHQFVVITLQDFFHILRDHTLRKCRSDDTFQTKYLFYTVYLFDIGNHVVFLFGIQILIQQDHMCRTHVVFFRQFCICLDTWESIRKAGIQVVVHTCMCLEISKRDKQYHK